MSYHKTIHEINKNVYLLVRITYPWLRHIPKQWSHIAKFIEGYTPIINYRVVQWRKHEEKSYKCNTDKTSKVNPGPCTIAYCISDWEENNNS